MLLTILLYIIIGAVLGVAAALLGIGGGIITVPALLIIFSFLDFPKDLIMQIAIATSISSMVINTFSATYFHHKKIMSYGKLSDVYF